MIERVETILRKRERARIDGAEIVECKRERGMIEGV